MVKLNGKGWKSAYTGETQRKVAKKKGGRNGNVGEKPAMEERG